MHLTLVLLGTFLRDQQPWQTPSGHSVMFVPYVRDGTLFVAKEGKRVLKAIKKSIRDLVQDTPFSTGEIRREMHRMGE